MEITINFSTDESTYGSNADGAYIDAYIEAVVNAVQAEYPDARVYSTYRELMDSIQVSGVDEEEAIEVEENVKYHIRDVFDRQQF